MVKNAPAMQETQETQARSLGWEDPLEEETETHPTILAWEVPEAEELAGCRPWGRKEPDATRCLSTAGPHTVAEHGREMRLPLQEPL